MTDFFATHSTGLSSPAARHAAITPADEDLPVIPRALFVAEAGNLVIRDEAGVDVTYPVEAGLLIPFRAVQVRAATTAVVVGWW